MALIGPPDFYLRNDLFYFAGSVDEVSLGKYVIDHADQKGGTGSIRTEFATKPRGGEENT